jgi:hypothetical protein
VELVYLALPLGTSNGWGVCGRYITRELARLVPVCLLTDRLDAELVGDELELAALRAVLAPEELQPSGRAVRSAGIDPVMERCLRERRQGVGLLLLHGRRFCRIHD